MPGPAPALLASALLAAPAGPTHRLPDGPERGGPPLAVTPLEDAERGRVGAPESVGDGVEKKTARARLRGQIMMFASRDTIASARVIQKDGTATDADADGRFELWLTPGEHTLILRAPGYDDLTVLVELEENEDALYEFRMGEDAEVGRYRTTVRQKKEVAVSSTRLRGDELNALPGSFGDPFRVIKSLPGTTQIAGFLPYVVVRGAAPGNTGYFLDGVRVPILFHLAVGPSVIHPYFIDSVDFYASGAPVRLGRFSSGMIEGRTRPGRRDRVRGEFDISLTNAGGIMEIPLNRKHDRDCRKKAKTRKERRACPKGPARGSLTIAGRYGYTSALLSLLQQDTRIGFWDYQARFDHRLGPRANYTAFAYGSYDDVGQKDEENPILRFVFHRFQQRVRQDLPDGAVNYSLAFGFENTGISENDTVQWRIAPRIDIRRRVGRSKTTELGLGIDQEFQIFRATIPDDLEDPGTLENLSAVLGNRFVSATGVYGEVLWKKGNVEIRPGIRSDLYVQTGVSAVLPAATNVTYAIGFDPRILLRERVAERWTLRQNFGLYHQPPTSPIPLPGVESFGFEWGLQRNLQGSFGYEFKIADKFILTQDVYAGWLSNLLDYDLATALEQPVTEIEDLVIQMTGFAYGLETMLRLDPRLRAYGWAAYTLSRSVRNYESGGTAPSSWDQTHILNVVLGYKLKNKWNLGGRLHYNTGRPYTAVTGDQSFADALAMNRNQQRLPGFFQVDLRIERNWRFRKWYLQLIFDLLNATYSREVLACLQPGTDDGFGLTMSDTGVATLYDPPGCNAQGLRYVLPSIGVRGVF